MAKELIEDFIYYDREDGLYRTISEEYIKDAESALVYFGDSCFEQQLDSEGVLTIYKLVPHIRIKRNIEYNLEKV